MQRARDTIIERESGGVLYVRVLGGEREALVERTIASIPGVVRDAERAGATQIVLDVTGVDDGASYRLLPTVVLTCREAKRAGISVRVVAGHHLRASASVAGLTGVLAIDG